MNIEDHILNRMIIYENENIRNHNIIVFIRIDSKECEITYQECRDSGILGNIKIINYFTPYGKKIFDELIGKGGIPLIFPYWYSIISKKAVIGYKPVKLAINDLSCILYSNI
jgi:hypothetical protein